MPKTKKPSLKKFGQLHPVEREKELRKLAIENKSRKFFEIISEEIEKAELEQEHSESLEKIPEKEEKKPEELGELVKRESEELEESEKKEKIKIGKIYGHPAEEDNGSGYIINAPYENKKEEIKIEFTSTSENLLKQKEINIGEETIKKTTELYKHKKKVEEHGH